MSSIDETKEAELAQIVAQALQRAHEIGKEAEFMEMLPDIFRQTLDDSANALLVILKSDAPEMLEEHRQLRVGFEERLYERWGRALDLFEMVLVIAQEAGDKFRTQHEERAVRERDLVFWVLLRLHARACQIASEVLTLLRSGYATAAMARWRTIHELAVVMTLIKKHGQELAQRYLDWEAIETARNAKAYQLHHKDLGYEPYTTEELSAMQRRRDDVINKYKLGSSSKHNYGWAAKVIGNPQPNFSLLEKAAGLDHMIPFYHMASHGIHSHSKGILFQLGQIEPERALLAGASNAGLADPGHTTLTSLLQCTTTYICTEPNIEALITLKAMAHLVDEAGQAFLAAHKALVRDEEELQTRLSQREMDDSSDAHII